MQPDKVMNTFLTDKIETNLTYVYKPVIKLMIFVKIILKTT